MASSLINNDHKAELWFYAEACYERGRSQPRSATLSPFRTPDSHVRMNSRSFTMKSIAACAHRTSARARFHLKKCAPTASRGFLSETQHPGTGITTRYQYNLLGQRVRKMDASQNTIALYGEAEQGMESMALGLYNSTTATGATEVIYLPTASGPMPIATLVKGVKYAIHSDHLNTPRRLIQSDGKAAWQWVTSAFGEVPPTTGKTRFVSPKVNPATTGTTTLASFDLRYPGQVEDTESGLFYNHNRFYDPVTGRYLQSDPIGLNRGWNRFGYVEGNPLSMIDQTGLAGIMPSGRFWEPTVIDSGSSCGPMLPQSRVDDSGCISTGGGQSICFGPGAIGSVATNLAEQMAMQAARDGLHNSRSSTS